MRLRVVSAATGLLAAAMTLAADASQDRAGESAPGPVASVRPAVRIDYPPANVAVVNDIAIAVSTAPPDVAPVSITIFVDGRELCRRDAPPWSCRWNAGPQIREHHIRVVARFPGGARAVANRRTRGLEVAETVEVIAVQVPVLVINGFGRFQRGLRRDDFTLIEEGRPQRIDTVIDDSLPLELIVAVDVSNSMEEAMPRVRDAVKRLLAQLRPGDTVTLLGFNDTMFLLAERESDPDLREAAVEGLVPWGGTALFDATVKAIELVSRQAGRRGVIIFSDGDDRHSVGRREEALARIQEGQAVVYTIGFGQATTPQFRETLTTFAEASGGRAFFPRRTEELDDAFASIFEELSHQYVLSYVSNSPREGGWRRIQVRARCTGCKVRAREGYRAPER